jgi:phosphonopyruvate decarboxylase
MIAPKQFCQLLSKHDMGFYCGVPDSLLKNLCAYVEGEFSAEQHIITANEGNAVALATGHYLGSGRPAVVYMQNSGMGNAINPLTSLADPAVYGIPMLLVIGWRGEPGVKDEPQHVKQGEISAEQLNVLGIPYAVIDATSDLDAVIAPLLKSMSHQSRPVALLVRKGTFSPYAKALKKTDEPANYAMGREHALTVLMELFADEDLVVSTTGKTSREVFEIRQQGAHEANDFLCVGGMGHTSSIAMGVALARPQRRVIAIDGDGSMLMHMGALPIIGCHSGANLVHVVLNNQSHESVGGQPTVAGKIDIGKIVLASGYNGYWCADDEVSLRGIWPNLANTLGPVFLELKIAIGSRDDLGRPTSTPVQNKQAFMGHVGSV